MFGFVIFLFLRFAGLVHPCKQLLYEYVRTYLPLPPEHIGRRGEGGGGGGEGASRKDGVSLPFFFRELSENLDFSSREKPSTYGRIPASSSSGIFWIYLILFHRLMVVLCSLWPGKVQRQRWTHYRRVLARRDHQLR